MRTLITGGGGQLASDLVELLGDDAIAFSHAELDVADTEALARALDEVAPDLVINCAAFHNLDVCEAEPDRAWAVNVRAVREMASRVPRLVHLSTNYVFDGRRPEPYGEDDVPAPHSIYAISKLAGVDVPVEAAATVVPPGGVDRPLNGVLARPRADALGLPALRPWREGLEDYMSRAGLAAQLR